jgi:hypothetical protein
MAQSARPQLVSPRAVQTLEAVRNVAGGFDVDAWHVMEERDDALIADEILNGPGSSKFVYNFEIMPGTTVTGISVVGASHLANHYGGLQHRIVASMQKTGALFTFTSYPAENIPMNVDTKIILELEDEDDFYSAVCEMKDIKTGNSIQIERREKRYEHRRRGGDYERPHYATIAQRKAYRNAVLSLVPQDIVIRWKVAQLKLGKDDIITPSVLEEKRGNVLRFAAQRAISLDRRAIEKLTLQQIGGLGDAAREGKLPAFVEAARALGLEVDQGTEAAEPPKEQQQQQQTPAGDGRRRRRQDPGSAAGSGPPGPENGGRPGGRVDFEA